MLRFLFFLILCFGLLNANAQIDSTITFAKKNNFSKTYSAYKGCYCSCIPMKGKGAEGVLIGADSSRIYLAQGKVLLGKNDTSNFYGDYSLADWISIDTVSFFINDLYRVVVHQRPGDHIESKMDKFIDWIFETPGYSHHGDSFLGALIIAAPFMIVVYPTEFFLHPDNRKVRSFDMRAWEVKK